MIRWLAIALALWISPVQADGFFTPSIAAGASAPVSGFYASTCSVNVNSQTPTSTFCPVATDPQSAVKRTYPANTLTPGRSFYLMGGGLYTVPAANTLAADVKINVGTSNVMSLTTPAAPVGTNQGVEFYAICTVRPSSMINCQGSFKFIVAGALGAPIGFSQTNPFNPAVANVIDVTGDWNGAVTTHSTIVDEAILIGLN